MRATLLTLLLTSSFAGCLAGTGTPEDADGADEAVTPEPKTVTLDFGSTPVGYDPRPLPAGVAEEPYHQSLPFEVPVGATRLSAAAAWSCVSLCRIELRLHDPADAVAARAMGAGEETLQVDGPAAGTWAFEWITDEVASVDVQGTVTVTIHFD